jgi:hypothetical protein
LSLTLPFPGSGFFFGADCVGFGGRTMEEVPRRVLYNSFSVRLAFDALKLIEDQSNIVNEQYSMRASLLKNDCLSIFRMNLNQTLRLPKIEHGVPCTSFLFSLPLF